jgi:hypothetical protein
MSTKTATCFLVAIPGHKAAQTRCIALKQDVEVLDTVFLHLILLTDRVIRILIYHHFIQKLADANDFSLIEVHAEAGAGAIFWWCQLDYLALHRLFEKKASSQAIRNVVIDYHNSVELHRVLLVVEILRWRCRQYPRMHGMSSSCRTFSCAAGIVGNSSVLWASHIQR